MPLHFRKHFLVHLFHLLWSSCKSVKWVFVLHFTERKPRLRKINVTVQNILWQYSNPNVPLSKPVQKVPDSGWFDIAIFQLYDGAKAIYIHPLETLLGTGWSVESGG